MHDVTTHDGKASSVDSGTLRKIGIVAVIVAVLLVAWGLYSRHRSDAKLTTWTQQQATPTVAVVAPKPMDTGNSLMLPGNVQAYNSAPLYARTNGYVSKWFVDIGSPVKAGQVMAVIDIPDVDQQLVAARADLQTAKANEALASTTSARWSTLLQRDAVSKQEADEKSGDYAAKHAVTNAAVANVNRLVALQGFSRITAPFSGVVTSRATQIGQLVTSGNSAAQPLFTVSDISRMRIYVRVPQAYSAELHPGLHAALTLPEYPGRSFDATMTRTADAVDQQSGTVLVELQAVNSDGALKPGAYAQVRFPIAGTQGSVVVPASAIINRSDSLFVAVAGPDGKAAVRPIKIGRDMGDTVEVTSGVGRSDKVIDSPPDSIENGDPIRIEAPKQNQQNQKPGVADASH